MLEHIYNVAKQGKFKLQAKDNGNAAGVVGGDDADEDAAAAADVAGGTEVG